MFHERILTTAIKAEGRHIRLARCGYHVATVSPGMNDAEDYARLFAASLQMLKALQNIADTTLWAEPIEDEDRRKDEAFSGEYDLEEDQYEPSADTESMLLSETVQLARTTLATLTEGE